VGLVACVQLKFGMCGMCDISDCLTPGAALWKPWLIVAAGIYCMWSCGGCSDALNIDGQAECRLGLAGAPAVWQLHADLVVLSNVCGLRAASCTL
jgi:hypothetical protein